jgi:hypothetical protein
MTHQGTRAHLDTHLDQCHFEAMSDYISKSEEQMAELKYMVRVCAFEVCLIAIYHVCLMMLLVGASIRACSNASCSVANLANVGCMFGSHASYHALARH